MTAMRLTHQQANQVAAALRIFQAVRHAGGWFQEYDGTNESIETMEHFEETAPLDDDQIEDLINAAYEGVVAVED